MKDATWLKSFIGGLGIVPSIKDPIKILCDNEDAFMFTKYPMDQGSLRYILRKNHCIQRESLLYTLS